MARITSRRSHLAILIAAAAAAGAARADAQVQRAELRTAVAARTADPIRVDGRLDEPAWQSAGPIGALVQREPFEGADPTESTDVRVLYDDDALYVGIACHDRSPHGIVSTQLTRDADLEVDDSITIVLDPFFDHRNGFFFEVNPAGARSDGQISNNSEELSRDWDGIWNAATAITADGWQAEIVIPFKTLRFKPGQHVWGFNVQRQIKRRNEIDRWTGARRNVWIGNLTEAGELSGIDDPRQGLGLDVRPYASGGEEDSDGQFTGGLDVFKSVTPNLNASLTVNTDFAETEADIRQVNLTRFPLFFPEKRAFFLEGAGVFDIAGLGFSEDLRPFFSRRVGLLEARNGSTDENVTVPILAGAKLTGRQSDYNIGFLDVATRRVPDQALDPQNLMALRVSRNLFEQSWIGGIITHGNPTGAGSNTLVGADARLATSSFRGNKNLAFEMFALRTDDGATGRSDTAAGVRLDYPNDLWDVNFNWKQIGKDFNPALGFVPRTGIRKASFGIEYGPRPERWGVRQFAFELESEYITNLQNRVENWNVFIAPLNVLMESGEHFEFNVEPAFEHLDEPFEISDGVVLLPGSYQWTRYRIQANTASKRAWVVDGEWGWGPFYDGTRRQLELGVTLKPSTHVALSAQADVNDISLVQGAFRTKLFTVRADYNFTPNVSWANLVQYDNESRIAGVQSRFRWIIHPGNDLFLVLNRGWYRTFENTWQGSFDRGSVKLQYTFRL